MFRKRISLNLTKFYKKRRASPFIEEGILIVFGLFVFIILLGSINQILDWFLTFSNQLLEEMSQKIPF
jgi:hypothetical protein